MMAEIKALHAAANPVETLFVVDSMTGQDAANTAKAFSEALPLTGVVLTKTDGDARGGAALSVRYITGKPIKFIGVGEKSDGLDVFHPDRVASRILDMGDVLSLVEQVEAGVDKDKAAKLAEKVAKGKKFDLNDMRDQLEQMQSMGGISGLMDKLPGMGQIPDSVKNQVTGQGDSAPDRHHQLHDQKGAPQPRAHQWLASCAHRARLRHAACRRQPPAEAIPADGENDGQAGPRRHEGDEGHDAWHAGDDGRRHVVPLTPLAHAACGGL
jgi:signal recognition particle subunit FFH/SRP54 (srp54)